MSTTSDQLDLFEFEEDDKDLRREHHLAHKRAKRKQYAKADYRRRGSNQIPVRNGMPFVIVPEVAPLIRELCDLCAIECPPEEGRVVKGQPGVGVLAARAALILKKPEAAVARRLYAIVHQKQLFTNAALIEALLMAMGAEHDYQYRYGEWPSCRADALERVSLDAEYAGKKVSPTKLLARANRLYEKGVRKALKHAPEVSQ